MTTPEAEPHVYLVPDISCDHCRNAIESEITPLDGVDNVVVDVEAKTVTVVGGSGEAILAAIGEAGYEVAG